MCKGRAGRGPGIPPCWTPRVPKPPNESEGGLGETSRRVPGGGQRRLKASNWGLSTPELALSNSTGARPWELRKWCEALSLSVSDSPTRCRATSPLPEGGPETPAPRPLGQPPWPGPGLAGLGHGQRVLPGLHLGAPAPGRAEP